MRYFQLHDFVDVLVAPGVKPHVCAALEFQLGHFRRENPENAGTRPVIRFEPYAEFGETAPVLFHLVSGASGRVLHAPLSRFAIVTRDQEFVVYSDTVEVLVNVLVQLVLLRRGFTFMHAAGWVDRNGLVTLVPGPGGVGKTALLSAAVMRHGVRLLGDDLVVVGSGGRAASFPRAFVLKSYHRSQFPDSFPTTRGALRRVVGPVMQFVKDNMPLRGVLRDALRRADRFEASSLWLQQSFTGEELYPVPVADLFGIDRIADGGKVSRVIYLERHVGAQFVKTDLPLPILVSRSMAVLQHEWVDYTRWFAQLGALDLVSWPEYFKSTHQALAAACEQAQCSLVQVPARASPAALESWFADHIGFQDGKA